MTEPGLELLLTALKDWSRTKHKAWPRWVALCPCHDDHTPSLTIDYRVPPSWPDDEPTVLVWCRICEANLLDVCAALGLKSRAILLGNDAWDDDVLGEPPPPARLPFPAMLDAWRKRLGATPDRLAYLRHKRGLTLKTVQEHGLGWDGWRYTLPVYENGSLVNLRRYLPGAEPKWLGLAGRSVEYLYPNVPKGTWALLCEGELDALVARQHGLPAVTSIGGVGTWADEWNELLAGKNVAIAYDCDEAGRSYARRREDELRGIAAAVKVIDLGLAEGDDITDWFVGYQRTAPQLKAVIRETPANGTPPQWQLPACRPRLRGDNMAKKKVPAEW